MAKKEQERFYSMVGDMFDKKKPSKPEVVEKKEETKDISKEIAKISEEVENTVKKVESRGTIEMRLEEVNKSVAKASIPAGSVITGNMTFKSDLVIEGEVDGDITCEKAVVVGNHAKIKGNIKAESLVINESVVNGDINVTKTVNIGKDSKITGNINTGTIELDSEIVGTIKATEAVKLLGGANVKGDITTPLISISSGAVVSGMFNVGVETKKDKK